MQRPGTASPIRLAALRVLFAVIATATSQAATPQRPSGGAAQKLVGIWEPVNYSEDLSLTDVFFVDSQTGWVSGAGGTILHTRNGGATWTAQLGGEPRSADQPITHLRFVDETHGWAIQPAGPYVKALLATTDGEHWSRVATLDVSAGLVDYAFTTPANGVYVNGNDNVVTILHTTDGGRTWTPVFPDSSCRARLEVKGLARDVNCTIKTLRMATPTIGYAFGPFSQTGVLAMLKTEDGGASWTVSTIPGLAKADSYLWSLTAFFVDADAGILGLDSRDLHATRDGGRTWRGLIGTFGSTFRFADPEVGWSFRGNTLSYTVDGGNRWSSREITFPSGVRAFSLPRRDHGYVVGDHGMIYRYRVVPAGTVVPKAIEAPAMPGVDPALHDAAVRIDQEVTALAGVVKASGGAGTALETCCAKQLSQVDTSLTTLTAAIPAFSGRFRNLNLLAAGTQLITQLTDQSQGLKTSFAALRKARDVQSLSAALTDLMAKASAVSQAAKAAFQQPTIEPNVK
jgi:photosystem II stability/assembly factor-like uncharacterized protein